MSHNLELMTERIRALGDARSWRPFHNPEGLVLTLNIEAGELAELFLWKTDAGATEMATDPATRTAIVDELADVAIYALLLAHHHGIDVGGAVVAKLDKNELKYPVERARGNAR